MTTTNETATAIHDAAPATGYPPPDWVYWANMTTITVMQACQLACGMGPCDDPASMGAAEVGRLATWATDATRNHCLKTVPHTPYLSELSDEQLLGRKTTFADFRAWGESLPRPWSFPDEWPTATQHPPTLEEYPEELRAAIDAFKAVRHDPKATARKTPKQALTKWLEEHQPALKKNARDRVATVANWEPGGGAPKSSD